MVRLRKNKEALHISVHQVIEMMGTLRIKLKSRSEIC